METTTEKTIKLPSFDGQAGQFQTWWIRFNAYATVHGFAAACTAQDEADLPATKATAIDTSTDAGKRAAAAKKRNMVAIASMTMAFKKESLMGMVQKAKDQNWPSGKASTIVKALIKKYQPKDRVARVEARQALNQIKMKTGEDPAVLFEQISAVRNRYKTQNQQLNTEELIAVVLDAAPEKYQSVLTTTQLTKGDQRTLDDLEEAMVQHWCKVKKKSRT